MPDKLKIYCLNLGEYVEADGGSSLLDIARGLTGRLGFEPLCARVNNKTEGLHYRVYAPKDVKFLSATDENSSRCYVRSLCMILYKAVTRLYPGAQLKIEHSISRGYFCRITGADVPVSAPQIEAEMRRIVAENLPFDFHEERTGETIKIFERQGLDARVNLIKSAHQPYTTYYTLDGLADKYYSCLAPSTGMIDVFAFTPYEHGFLLRGRDPRHPDVPPEPVEQAKMFHAFLDYVDFNHVLGISNVADLNFAIDGGRAKDLINVAEALHDRYLGRISDEITRRYHEGGARIILIAGPSSSGKTTTCKRLAIQLMTNLLRPVMISLDDYFVNREDTPRDAEGDYDYENIHALDLEQFNKDLGDLIAGKEVQLPTYSFETGRRYYKSTPTHMEPGDVLIIEGIHGLNPELTKHIPREQKFNIYVSALTTLSIDDHNWVPTTDNRLLRRIIRDYKYRGTSALDTLKRWPKVRAGEEKWIFPYQENADATFNSSLLFELSVMRDYADDILARVHSDVPQYATAYRLRKFLSYFRPLSVDAVPPTSLLREFLGGSSFQY